MAEKILAAGPAAQLLEDAQQKTLRQLYVGIWVESQQSRGCKADNDGLQAWSWSITEGWITDTKEASALSPMVKHVSTETAIKGTLGELAPS